MGMFDSVYATCPRCGEAVEFQSKAGACALNSYSVNSVPPSIAEDLAGDVEECQCGYRLRLMPAQPINRVAMLVEEGSKVWD